MPQAAAVTTPMFTALEAPAAWQTVDFISDLHLKPDEPGTVQAWAAYMARTTADALFILGDLFEVWIGDDSAAPGSFEAHCAEVLRAASQRLALYVMVGYRDFLVGSAFLERCGAHALADPTVLHFSGAHWLLTHGDLLCTDDVAYQQFRQQVRSPQWQQVMLARPSASTCASKVRRSRRTRVMRPMSTPIWRANGCCRRAPPPSSTATPIALGTTAWAQMPKAAHSPRWC